MTNHVEYFQGKKDLLFSKLLFFFFFQIAFIISIELITDIHPSTCSPLS